MSGNMNKPSPLVSVIIVNYNGKQYLKNCLSSLSAQSYPAIEVIFVDNGSVDGSVEHVRKEFPSIRIIESRKNLGFAKGNNMGIKEARGGEMDFSLLKGYWSDSLSHTRRDKCI